MLYQHPAAEGRRQCIACGFLMEQLVSGPSAGPGTSRSRLMQNRPTRRRRLSDEFISAAYCAMGSPVVVVRSSATAEDLAEASMAGQYETLLDISGEQDIEWTICDGRAVLLQSRAITTLADADAYREWLAQFGHRGPEEFDLAAPRWREQREEVRKMAAPLADGPSPAATHHARGWGGGRGSDRGGRRRLATLHAGEGLPRRRRGRSKTSRSLSRGGSSA